MATKQASKKSVKVRSAQQVQGRRPTARSEKTRLEVLNAAALCITKEGFATASTIRIAQQAGVSWGVLQYHFGNKEGLMSAVLKYSMEQTQNRFNDLITNGFTADTPLQRLRSLTRETWKIYSSPLARAATEIVINNRTQWQDVAEQDRYLLELDKTQMRLARRVMYCAIGDQKLANILAGIFLATLHGLEVRLLLYSSEHSLPRELDTLAEVLAAYVNKHATSAVGTDEQSSIGM